MELDFVHDFGHDERSIFLVEVDLDLLPVKALGVELGVGLALDSLEEMLCHEP